MRLSEFFKKEISGWKSYEIFSLLAVFALILYNTISLHDNPIAMLSAIFGIMYTIFAGLMGSACYIWLSVANHLYGNAFLYLLYYIPMQINGIFMWKNHLKEHSLEIEKTRLSVNKRIKYILLAFLGCLATCFMLYYMNDAEPLIDGITTFLSIIGMYFTVKRYFEQWIVWIVVNGLSFLMWLDLIMHGVKVYSTLVMWGFYLLMAIYFYFVWYKEIKKNNNNPINA